jgi:hypothetical protein
MEFISYGVYFMRSLIHIEFISCRVCFARLLFRAVTISRVIYFTWRDFSTRISFHIEIISVPRPRLWTGQAAKRAGRKA